jgi:ppGpp synthetase/RelA/SpoT-type nucleotidyltranferase
MPLSKSAVNRAGESLVAAFNSGDELPVDACEEVVTWREFHAEPLVWLTLSVRGRTEAPVSYRLKRLPQIVSKLARAGNMDLARMQDIGGCRLVVDTQADVDAALLSIERRAAPHYEVVRVTDYRRGGRQLTGYRAVHVILRRDGFLVELQLRTRRQHGWAEAVERAANRTEHKLKDGDGPAELVEFFRVASDCLSEVDDGRRPSKSTLEAFRRGYRSLPTYFRDLPDTHAGGIAVRTKSFSTRENNWLLIYNWTTGQSERWMDCGTDCVEAARTYSEYERRYPWRDGYEVVLIGSDSRDTIEWTHAHYFGRSADDLDPHGVLGELLAAA